jgi:hypothetical protein
MNEPRCPHNNPECSFDKDDEQALVGEIMHSIERRNRMRKRTPCPLCLRDTMLAVAALLHLEAARTGMTGGRKPRPGSKRYRDAFARAARTRLEEVTQASAAILRPKR